jgi:hypothetical protein
MKRASCVLGRYCIASKRAVAASKLIPVMHEELQIAELTETIVVGRALHPAPDPPLLQLTLSS